VKKAVNYAESEDDEDEVLQPLNANKLQRRPSKRRKVSLEDSDDEFGMDAETEAALAEAGTCVSHTLRAFAYQTL
jgi:DNA mismatch repair protein MSH6